MLSPWLFSPLAKKRPPSKNTQSCNTLLECLNMKKKRRERNPWRGENLAQKNGCSSWNSSYECRWRSGAFRSHPLLFVCFSHRKGQIWEWHLPLPGFVRGLVREKLGQRCESAFDTNQIRVLIFPNLISSCLRVSFCPNLSIFQNENTIYSCISLQSCWVKRKQLCWLQCPLDKKCVRRLS